MGAFKRYEDRHGGIASTFHLFGRARGHRPYVLSIRASTGASPLRFVYSGEHGGIAPTGPLTTDH